MNVMPTVMKRLLFFLRQDVNIIWVVFWIWKVIFVIELWKACCFPQFARLPLVPPYYSDTCYGDVWDSETTI
jgi:hypothetical protein